MTTIPSAYDGHSWPLECQPPSLSPARPFPSIPAKPPQIDASFTHSLLRVVPYDDCPLLPMSEDDPSTANTSSTTTSLSLSSSSAYTSSVGDLGRGGIGVGVSGFFGTTPHAGAAADGGGILRGGDVVRLCHLTSKGFLTHESVLRPARRKVGGLGPTGRGGDDAGEWEGAAKKEVRVAWVWKFSWCLWLAYCLRGAVGSMRGEHFFFCRRLATAVSTAESVDCAVWLGYGFGAQRHDFLGGGRVRVVLGYLNVVGLCPLVCGPGKRVRSAGTNGGKFYSAPSTLSFGTKEGHLDGVRGGSGPFLHVSTTPSRREKLQNASSNCLWVLERTHCALGGRPLRGSSGSTAEHENTWRKPSSSVGPSSTGNAVVGSHHRRHSDCTGTGLSTEARGSAAGAGDVRVVGANTGMSALASGGRDTYAEAVAIRRRRQGAGDAVEHVRVKHLASLRYLCVGSKCDSFSEEDTTARRAHGAGGDGGQVAEPSRRRGESRKGRGSAPRVGMVTVESHAAVPAATVFVIRPRTVVGSGVHLNTAADGLDRGLSPDDLVHLQHKDTGLFLSTLPHDEGSAGGNVGLTVVKSPLTTEVGHALVFFVCKRRN